MPIRNSSVYENTSFIERKDINEFLVEDRAIGDIYNQTLLYISTQIDQIAPLILFNDAYYLCTLVVKEKITWSQFLDVKFRYHRIIKGRDLVLDLVWCLLMLQDGLVEFDKDILPKLRNRCRSSQYFEGYYKIVRDYASDFQKVINFSGQAVEEKQPDTVSTVDQLMQAQKLVVVASERLIRENKELQDQIAQLQENHRRELENLRSQCNVADAENQRLLSLLKDKDDEIKALRKAAKSPKTIVKEVPREVLVDTPESKVFSAANMSHYAKGVENDSDANVIATMMKDLCLRNQYFNEDTLATIDSIRTDREAAKEAKQRRQQGLTTINIENVGTLAPAAQTVNNHHHDSKPDTDEPQRYRAFAQKYAGEVYESDDDDDSPFERSKRFLSHYRRR